ncbi:uncharacterized protein LOC122040206 [Zingiber officinale]|uniref:Uncharacterized protein n=1 Tax=Zingiber officinale TaxID=94328 RepID=A0A8J5LTR3_ZINOF|nr:uncharacterized protein LOC122040206 [Zingiber officinale]KAG6529968.1 hypothetical protein ZIOFF_012185 [Zingiber officinale]
MDIGGTMKSHRRTSSMIQFPSSRSGPTRLSRINQDSMDELLPTEARELERPLAARKLPSWKKNLVTEARPDDAADEMLVRSSAEGLVEYDGDLLLDMVHNLQHNMKQSLSECPRGRLYERYEQLRDEKLMQQWESIEWVRKKDAMETMEDMLEDIKAEMKIQFGYLADKSNSATTGPRCPRKQRSFSIGSGLELREKHLVDNFLRHAQNFEEVPIDDSSKSYDSRRVLSVNSSKGLLSSTRPPCQPSKTSSRLTKQRNNSEHSSMQRSVESSYLRKENMKPLETVRKVTSQLDSSTFDRSKSSTAGMDVLKDQKQSRFRHMRNSSSASFFELKELAPVNSDSPSLPISSFQEDQCTNTASKMMQARSEPKPFLRRGSGIGPGVGASIVKLRASKASEFGDVKSVDERGVSFGFTSNSAEISKTNVHEASDMDALAASPRGKPSASNTHHLHLMREADAARVRKKWGTVEKPNFATDSDQPMKDVAKMFKKLLKFGSKNKATDKRMTDSLSTSISSEGGDDAENVSDKGKQSLGELTKSRKLYAPCYNAALHDDRIFSEQVPGSFISFPSFNGRGTEVKA